MTIAKQLATIAFAAAALTVSSAAVSAHDYQYRYTHGAVSHVITVSCYRGPWQEVIWDRPNTVFTDSLVRAGYTFPEAHAIAERVCRDPSAVGSPETLRAVMNNILVTSPPRR